MRIVTLMENAACREGLQAAHGLSLYIETNGHRILLDMGPDEGFLQNADALGVDLSAVDIAVVSHGHYDHGGGLAAFLRRNGRARVYLRAGAFSPHYSIASGKEKYIGLDPALSDFAERFVTVTGTTEIGRGLTLFGDVPDEFGALSASGKLKAQGPDGRLRPDDFSHEQDLLAAEDGKAVVFGGCAHRGVVNIRARAAEILGREPDVMVSGFHLHQLEPGPESDELIDRIGAALAEGETAYYTGHCTGEYGYERLKARLGDRLHRIMAGTEWEL